MAEQDLDRNQPATQHKLDDARKKGQVAKSADLVSSLVFGAAMLYFHASGFQALTEQFRFDRLLLSTATRAGRADPVYWPAVIEAARHGAALILPVLLLIMVAAMLANLVQVGAVWSSTPVKPDWQRLNPVTGFKRIFSLRTLFETFRALVKLAVMSLVVYFALESLVPQFHEIASLSGLAFLKMLHADLASVGWKLALTMFVIALLDLGYTRREFAKKMRMSHREIKDEHKNREGDPRIRRRIRELQREMLQRSASISRTRDASVLLTNPTHYAVALRYEHGRMAAPVLLAKGTGIVAKVMRAIAARHGIPVVAMPSLARALHAEMQPDQQVPAAHYAAVARIMIWVINSRRARHAATSTSAEGARA
jgi:flagellar biosynthesis protein FlhB